MSVAEISVEGTTFGSIRRSKSISTALPLRSNPGYLCLAYVVIWMNSSSIFFQTHLGLGKFAPLQACFDEEVHRKTIKDRFLDRDTSNNFRGADCWKRGRMMSIDFKIIGEDLNSYFGWALHRKSIEYKKYEDAGGGGDSDEFELLTHMIAAGEDIESNQDYLDQYYGHYYYFVNRGGLTLVSPLYAKLFHQIYFTICLRLNSKILFVDKNKKQMEIARSTVMENVPAWVEQLKKIAESELHLEDPSKTCTKLLSAIITKVFNARSNTLLKRYQSTHLARGGSKAVRSAFREDMKHASGKGKKRSRNT